MCLPPLSPPKPAWHIRRAGGGVWPPGRQWGVRKRPAIARLPCASKPSLARRPLRPGKVPNWRSPSLAGQWVKLGMCTRLMAAKMAVTSSRIIVGPRERHERHWDPPRHGAAEAHAQRAWTSDKTGSVLSLCRSVALPLLLPRAAACCRAARARHPMGIATKSGARFDRHARRATSQPGLAAGGIANRHAART